MTSVPGFRQGVVLHSATDCVVYRAVREADDLPVVLKILASEIPTPRELMRYRQEFKILRSIPVSDYVLQGYDLLETGEAVAIVLEDFGGIALNRCDFVERLAIDEVLSLAIAVATGLGQIHAASVIHKDINPGNLLYRRESGLVKIGDFGLASLLSRENPVIGHLEGLEGTPSYISPEQTGRMNRSLDYRTDLYSFGATLYELLAGRPPFAALSMMELVHCHIAKLAPPPHEVDSRVPRVLSEITMKLLAKTPEARYQSAFGVKADLERCLEQRRQGGPIISFPIAEKDVSDRLNIPQKLYGRKRELDALLAGFEEVVCQGGLRAVMISGSPGIGKTSLVQEIYKPMTQHQGTYICGRFDPLRRDTPYFALGAACQQLVDHVLGQEEEQIKRWRDEILAAVAACGQVLIDFVPSLALVLGPQPPVPELAPAESQYRFFQMFQKLIGVFANRNHPLVLFLDDLQWADAASFKLLSALLCGAKEMSLLFIGAYRDNEVDAAHPLLLALEEVQAETPLRRLPLAPLEDEDVAQLLVDALRCAPQAAAELAAQVKGKTDGNPFFINEYLEFLANERWLAFDVQAGIWKWDLQAIASTELTKNVIDLLTEKIQRMDPRNQRVLSLAACLGGRFSLETLAEHLDLTPRPTLQLLYPAVRAGLILPLGDAYQLVEYEATPQGGLQAAEFRFGHDRIRAAAYALLTDPEKEATHLGMGRALLAHNPPEQDESRLFEITNHLNRARGSLSSWEERVHLARLNLRAGQKAKGSAAYDLASSSLVCGRELLGADGWARERELALALSAEAAEASFLGTDFEQMWALTGEAIAHATTALEKVHPYQVRIWGFLAQNDPGQAIRTALVLLRLLGMDFPENPSKARVLLTLLRTRALLKRKGIESLAQLPALQNASVDAAIRIIRSMSAALFQANPKLHVLLLCKQLQLLFRHGNNQWSASIAGAFGILLCGLLGDLDAGFRIGKVSQVLMDLYPHPASRCRTLYLFYCFEGHVKDSLASTLQPLAEGYRIGLDTGDLEYASFCAHVHCQHAYFLGRELLTLEKEIAVYTDGIRHLKQQKQLGYNELFLQAAQNLLGRSADPCLLVGEAFDAGSALPRLQAASDGSGVFAVHFHRLALCCLFGRYEEALEAADLARETMATTRGMFIFARFHFYDSLARLMVSEESPAARRKELMKTVARNQKRLRASAAFSPVNHLHLHTLIEAERLRILGKTAQAMDRYDEALEQAATSGFINDLALVQELCGVFYLDRGKSRMAQACLSEARVSYLKWGASAKVEALERQHETLLRRSAASTAKASGSVHDGSVRHTTTLSSTIHSTLSTTTSQGHTDAFDLESVIKATQSISSQIVLSELLDLLIKTAVENAGADKGVLLINSEGELSVEARYLVALDRKVQVESLPLAQYAEMSHAIVRFASRTRQIVVLGDAIHDGAFVQDPYIVERQPRSVLCIPIVRNNQTSGALYLENSQASDAFTPQRVQLLGMLATQAAISLDNAKLYDKLERALAEARESARVKSEFLARTSHELRTPLNAIINIPGGLLQRFSSAGTLSCASCAARFTLDPGEICEADTPCPRCAHTPLTPQEGFLFEGDHNDLRRMLQIAMRSGTHLLSVVNDILDINKLEAGKEQLCPQELDVLLSIGNVIDAFSTQAGQKRIDIIRPDVAEAILLVADQTKIEQILFNLLGNAVKFTPEGGKVVVNVQTGQVGVLLSVHDQGIGIALEYQEKIFESFFQVEGGSTRRAGGTGLGLAITKKLTELHGGRIWVESELGKGSSFFVEIPWQTQTP